MSRDAVKTLFHPFAAGNVATPAAGDRVLFLGAEAGFALPRDFDGDVFAVQGLRPLFRQLQAAHVDVSPELSEGEYQCGLVLCGRHKGENENRIAEALTHVVAGGMIVVAGSKEDGIQSLRKRLEKLGLVVDSLPKYHGVALWFPRPDDAGALVAELQKKAVRIDDRFSAIPGMFSHERADAGSELLAARLPTDFNGNAADFGAGWGFLSVALADRSPMVNRIDLYEADHEALEYARKNMAENCPSVQARFFWYDLATEEVKDRYDLVIMNPPFHEAHAAEPALGQAFIKTAATALKSGGRLLLVANRGLPYETALTAGLKESGEVCRNARYKVLWARK